MKISSFRPRYLVRRLAQMRFRHVQPDAPWLTSAAVLFLDSYLKPTDVGIEWGSGRSTIWFAKRVSHLTSIEDSEVWYRRVKTALETEHLLAKVNYRFVPCELHEQDEPLHHPYASVAAGLPDCSLDFALVDGNIRATCMKQALPKLKPGGLLILDNANRYVPNLQLGRFATVHEPRSEPRTPLWAEIIASLKNWRWINLSDGIWDTRLWIKPCELRS